MLLRPNNRTKCHTACMILLVWLFTLASGTANACLLVARVSYSQGTLAVHLPATDAAIATAQVHAVGTAHDEYGPNTEPAKKSCLKACEEGSLSLLKQPFSLDTSHLGLAPFVAIAWAVESHASTLFSRAHDLRLPEYGPPIRVLYSRLAL
ncbi:MAG: hypothetical protein H7274_02870 [Rhodoferax sp.]|nr:hypothetical protein [Rhodoferax sp.]